jgi:hypothetical protein
MMLDKGAMFGIENSFFASLKKETASSSSNPPSKQLS